MEEVHIQLTVPSQLAEQLNDRVREERRRSGNTTTLSAYIESLIWRDLAQHEGEAHG